MNLLTTLLRPLGNDRALANAKAMLEARDREDWLVQGLANRLDRLPAVAVEPTARVSSTGA